jgi:hypothetical protein
MWLLDFLTGWFGLGAVIAAAAVAVAVLLPPWLAVWIPNLRAAAIAVALIAGAFSTIYAKGYFDGAAEIREEWEDAKSEAVKRAEKARLDAERSIGKRPTPGVRDKLNRD